MRTSLLLVAALAASAVAGPTGQRSTCALHCTDSETFRYATGKSYVYDYSVTTSTALLETFDDDTQMHITAKANIDVTSPCDYILRLTDVNLEGSTHTTEFREAVMQYPLRFSFQDGVVENVCSEVSEPTWVLNFKRGVLSSFQNSMNHLNNEVVKETDISGTCTTRYEVSTEGDVTTVQKIKELSSCSQRPDPTTYIASTTYATDSPIQSLPIFKSTSNCSQKIVEGVLQEVECEETHKFRPFSSEEGGAITKVKNTMRLVSQEQATTIAADIQFFRKSLVFETDSQVMTEAKVELIEKILSDLKTASLEEITSKVPALFSSLVTALKNVNYPQLSSIYNSIQEPKVKKFLIDAMPLVGTSSSAAIVRDMIKNGEMTENEQDVWFTSLAFLKNPDSDMFTALAPLLQETPSQKAMLGISALVNNYCKVNADCETDSGVIQVIRRIESQLGSGCRAVNELEREKILVTLKALGNAGHWVNANTILRRCYAEEENNMEIRVAALEAWRHTPCEYDRSNVLAAYQDETQDPEIRIAAYLALMTCPTQTLIDTIKTKLTSEGVNQVGSFVWTHLTNMQESASPEKQWMRELIGEEMLQNKFSTEALKFSRNYESSFFMNELNTGATVESNIIFSGKSFLPRSAMLNLTLDLFGESINFFEVGGRIEGFEAYVERFFGPSGYFPEETVEAIVRNMREQKTDYEPTTLEGFLDKVTDEPEGSYYMRIFGNELHYHHFRGLENIISSSGTTNPLEFLMELARKGNVDYTKSYQLFDTHYTIPTIIGMPVTLTAKGTATIGIEMNGNFKAKSMKNVNIEGSFKPSAAVEIDALMVLDAHVTRTGLKITSNLHSSTYIDGKIQINKGNLVDVAFNTPKDKVEILNVQTKFFYLENDEEMEKSPANQVASEGCTKGTIGIDLCGAYNYTPRKTSGPMFPLVGPFGANLYIKKTDSQTGYVLQFSREQNEIRFLADTPGSQNDHKFSFNLGKTDNALSIDIHTPFKSAKGSGEYIWQKNNKNIKINLDVDGKQYGLDTSIITDAAAKKIEPSIVITTPEGELINMQGSLTIGDQSRELNIKVQSPVFDTVLNTKLAFENTFISVISDMEYSVMKQTTQTIHQSALIKKEISDQVQTYSAKFELTPSQYSEMAINLDYKTVISNNGYHIESTGKLMRGPATWEAHQLWLYSSENRQKIFKNELLLKSPYYGIDYTASQSLSFSQNSLQGNILFRVAPGKECSLTVSLSKNRNTELLGNIAVQCCDFKTSVEGNYVKIASGQHKAQIITKFADETFVVEGTVKNTSSQGKISAVIEGMFKCSLYDIKSNLGITADKEKALVDINTTVNGREYTVKMEGSATSILIDINIIKHILLNAYVTSSSNVNKFLINAEWDKDVDPTKAFVIDAELTSKSVLLNLKFVDKEFLLSSKLMNTGAELEAKWAPNKRILANIEYTTGETTSVSTSVQTPFQGWEKQDATFTLTLKENKLNGRFAVTWRNSEQISMTVNALVEPGMFANAAKASIVFTSTFDDFERITFMLEHSMNDLTVDSKVECVWNNKESNARFHLLPKENGIEGRLNVVSPFTEELLITLDHALQGTTLSSTFEAKYGSDFTAIIMKGHVDLSRTQDITLVFKITSSMSIPEISANINYKNDGSLLKLIVDGVMGEQKLMLNVNGKLITGDTTTITGDIRFITPFTYPLTAIIYHTADAQTFTSEFEMSRIWSTYGNLKLHAEGQMISKTDMKLNAVLSSPSNKASLSFTHKIADGKMTSSVATILNGERIFASVDGTVDTSSYLTDVKAEITSTFSELDDIQVSLKSEKNGKTRTSNAVFTKGTKSVSIDHIITINDLFNWENSFKIDGKYMLNNKQTGTGSSIMHELEYIWENESVNIALKFDRKNNGDSKEIIAQLSLDSPWTESMKADLQFIYGESEYMPFIAIEYAPGMKIEISHIIRVHEAFFYIEGSLVTPFWQTLGYKLNLDMNRSSVTLVLLRGNNETTIKVGGKRETGKLEGTLEIESTYLALPFSVEVAYDVMSVEKSVKLFVNYDKRYEFSGSLSGSISSARWIVSLDIPIAMVKQIRFSGEYNIDNMPLSGKVSLQLDSKNYNIEGQMNTSELTINANIDGKKGSLSSKWFFSHTKSDILIRFESPFSVADNLSLYVMYDVSSEKKMNMKLVKGTSEINLSGKLENGSVLIDATTPFTGWETLKASFFLSESAIHAFVSRNDRKIEVSGTLHVRVVKGKINLTITTPYSNYEQISMELSYSMQSPVKIVEFTSNFGTQQILLKGVIDVTDLLAPEMKLDITTPFDVVKRLGGMVQWNFKESTKTLIAKVYRNDREYQWEINATADSAFKGHATAKIVTPLAGWTTVKVEGRFDFTSMPYTFVFTSEKEGVVSTFEGRVNIEHNSVSIDLATPITNWEKIVLNGDYTFENSQFTFNTEIKINSEKYLVSGDLLFNTQRPKVNIAIKSPMSTASEIKFTFESNLVDTSKKIFVTLNVNDTTYSLDTNWEIRNKNGYMNLKIQSPITGFTSFETDAKFDFNGDIKTAEIDLKKESQNHHISVSARVNDNNVFIEIETPFEMIGKINLNGDYTSYNNEHVLQAGFLANNEKYAITAKVLPNEHMVTLKVETPYNKMKDLTLTGKYTLLDDGIEASLRFENANEVFNLNTRGIFTYMKSILDISVETPIEGWKKMALNANYDVETGKKSATLVITRDSFVKKVSIEGLYNLRYGSFKVETPVTGFRVLGAEYNFDINKRTKQLGAHIKLFTDSEEWTFAAQGQYQDSSFMIKFQTPIAGFRTVSAEGNIDFDKKTGKGIIEFGAYKFTVNVSYTKGKYMFEITTPFEGLKMLSLGAQYTWTENTKDAGLKIQYNDKIYELKGTLTLSPRASGILLQATTPFQDFDSFTVLAKYDIDNTNELISVQMTSNSKTYGLKMSGYIKEKLAQWNWELITPFSGWTDVKFVSKIDLTSDDKNLIISMERDGNVKEINISGKLIGETLDFNLKTPFKGIEKFQIFGALNRAKRSLEFRMMNDAGEASLISNFNSVSLHLKTPFEVAEEITWEIKKVNDNTIVAEWKRNDNYVTLHVEKQGKKAAFNVEIKSEFQGWELLAVTGRLDREELRGYLSGSINEDKVVVSGSGQFDTKGTFTMNIQTPYDNYKTVDVNLEYNARKKVGKLEASSSSSNFHLILERDKAGVIIGHAIFPNPQQPTEITMNLGLYSGKMTITSRFPLLRDYYQEYSANLGPIIAVNHVIRLNDLEIFKMDIQHHGPDNKLDLEMHFRRTGHETTIELHRDGYSSAHFLVRRDDKEFKIDVQGSGQLPTKGEYDIDIVNSFREVPRNIKAHVNFDIADSTDRKQIKTEISFSRSSLYIFDLKYSVDRSDYKNGDFQLAITTPDRSNAPWKNVSGSWNVDTQSNVNITLNAGGMEYSAEGKLTPRESTLVLVPKRPGAERIFLQWTFYREGDSKDYFLKFGKESRYTLFKLKGSIIDYAHVDVEGGFKFGAYMQNELLFTTKWNKGSDGTVTGGGSFSYGNYNGEHTVSFKRNAATKSATFEASGTSNIPNYERVSLSGNYDFNKKAVLHVLVHANDRESKIDVNFEDIKPSHSRNTVNINIPILGTYGQTEITLSHDIRRNSGKFLKAIATISGREAFVQVNWKRSDNFDTLEGTIDIKSVFVGEIHIKGNFDFTNMDDARAEATYRRATPSGVTKTGSLIWTRKSTPGHLKNELVIETPLDILKNGHISVDVDYSSAFKVSALAQRNERQLTFDLDIQEGSITGKITTPYRNFELMEGSLTYDLPGKTKTVKLEYARGSRKVNLDLTLNVKAKKEGDFVLDLTTPFEVLNNVHIDGKWSKKKIEVNYQRNDIVMNFSGKADIKADKSSFDITFDAPSGQTVKVAGSYDVKDFLEGTGSEPTRLANLELEFEGNNLNFHVDGFRNSEKVFVEIQGQSSFALVKTFHVKLDSQLNTQLRDGRFEVHVNDFEFKMHNHFERRAGNGYYFRSQVESTLTPLPALIFGIGREGEERIITIGYGEDKEITFSIKGKDNFESGFSGYVDIPNFGFEGVKYDVEYEFRGDNELYIELEMELGNEGELEAHFVYNSEGVRARLNSLRTGEHHIRFRRSVSSNAFFIETGVDDYNLNLRGGFNNGDMKRGFVLEGEVFGRRIMIDALFQSEGLEYTEGKFLITTPFQGWESIGGLFTWACSNKNIISRAEVHLPSYITPKITAEINLNLDKKIEGYVTINVAGEEFKLTSKLAGSFSEGYNGMIEIKTPFHSISSIKINGSFKGNKNSLSANLNIQAPTAEHKVQVEVKYVTNEMTANIILQSSRLSETYNIDVKLEKTGSTYRKAYLGMNTNKITAEWNLDGRSFLMNFDSLIMGTQRQFSVEANLESLQNMNGSITVIFGEHTHKIHGDLNMSTNQAKGTFELESTLINGKRAVTFDILAPGTSYKKVICNVIFVSEQSHTLLFDLDATNGIHINLKIDTPLFPKVNGAFDLTPASLTILIETPTGAHKFTSGWRVTRRMPADYSANIELASPILPVDYTFGIVFGGNHEKRVLKAELMAGNEKHLFEGMTSMTGNGGSFSLNIETPIKNINKASIEASLEFGTKVLLHISGSFGNKISTFDLSYDKESRMFLSVLESPFVPTGMIKAEAQLTGEINKNMKVKMDLKNNEKSLSGLLSVKTNSLRDIDMDLKITTPFKGYKKMNFGIQYKKTDDITILLIVDKPVKFTAEMRLGTLKDVIKADLRIETSVKNIETIEGSVFIPLTTFEPKISANMKIDNQYYGGYLGMRTKAPYELAYGLQVPNWVDSKFHIRTDSSFISMLA